MDEYKSIIGERVDYGKIVFTLDKLMKSKGITRNKLSKLIDVHYEVVQRFYSGNLERLDLDILARICFALDCSVSDLISYEAPKQEK